MKATSIAGLSPVASVGMSVDHRGAVVPETPNDVLAMDISMILTNIDVRPIAPFRKRGNLF
ncbi:hypothetical protein [Gluconobacter thailandicus]|uniref:Uncharacterized protein n=1 Tax=Gluconobacter thailandicus TaxID=257438 RepID=A0AAP9JHD7_GLUTH|nr:hypothetical protein [Gluconobacter thailandicus]QEH96212.1 hypothetical protein FXF46_07925 [Gluconobacter thailandicus]